MKPELYIPISGHRRNSLVADPRPAVAITKTGALSFNARAIQLLGGTSDHDVVEVLFYHYQTGEIGLRLARAKDSENVRLTLKRDQYGAWRLGLSGYFRHYSIDPATIAGRYVLGQDPDNALCVIPIQARAVIDTSGVRKRLDAARQGVAA